MSKGHRPREQSLSIFGAAFAVSLMVVEWILLVAGTRRDEMIVGALSVLLASVFLAYVYRSSTLHVKFAGADLANGWRVPGCIAMDAFVVSKLLIRNLISPRKPASFYRVFGFKSARRDPRMVGRRVLVTLYTTASPNSIVIGVDESQSRMLVHQLERSDVSQLARNLGAQP